MIWLFFNVILAKKIFDSLFHMKKTFFFLLMCCSSHLLSAQDVNNDTIISADIITELIEVLPDSTMHISKPYKELEPQLLADIDWLNYTPLNDKRNDVRNEKSRFVLMWVSGSPYVSVGVDERIMKFAKVSSWTLLAYMMGWTKYSLEHNNDNDEVKCTVAGLTNAIEFYRRNKDFTSKDKEMERLSKIMDEGKLGEYVKTTLES